MLREGKIGVFEAISVITFMSATKVLYSSSRALVEASGTSGWLTTIVSGVTALAGFYFIILLMSRFPGQELVSVFETVFGRFAGIIFSLLMSVFFLLNSAMFAREFIEAVKVYAYPLSPPSFLLVIFILAIITVLYFGFECVARTAALFAWPMLAGLAVIVILAVPLYEMSNLYPVLGHGPACIIKTGLLRSSVYGDALALAVVINSLQGSEHFKKSGVTAIILSTAIIATGFLIYNLSFPYYIASESTIPVYALTRSIEYGRFFQRFEAIFLFVWSISGILASAINLYFALSTYSKVFRIDDHRALILPQTVIIFSVSLIPLDISSIAYEHVNHIRQYGSAIYFGIPLLALLVAVIRGIRGEQAGA
ncbi:MAG TPA: endospore germination permease [Bacillota bacterium]|nr:endospore germination permease [Bacillota bacterium]